MLLFFWKLRMGRDGFAIISAAIILYFCPLESRWVQLSDKLPNIPEK